MSHPQRLKSGRMPDGPGGRWVAVFLLFAVMGAGTEPPLVGQAQVRQGSPGMEATLPELPVVIPLEEVEIPDLGLQRMGSCCRESSFTRLAPEFAEAVPEKVGEKRRFAVVKLGLSKILLSIDEIQRLPLRDGSKGEVLVRADANQNFDLTDDRVYRCRESEWCGPIRTEVEHPDGHAPYSFRVKFFMVGRTAVLWYTRHSALAGKLLGRKIAVLDDDTNGSYNDPGDIVVLDLDDDGDLEGGYKGEERFLRYRVLPWGEGFLSIVGVDPVARVMTVDAARAATLIAKVFDIQDGSPVAGAEVMVAPGSFSGQSDREGWVTLKVLAGQVDYLQVSADGYWSRVISRGADGIRAGKKPEDPEIHVLLEPGPCHHRQVRWCGKASLLASSMTHSRLDLDSGVVGPRIGPYPGTPDVGWYVPPEGLYLSASNGAGLSVLGEVDFEKVTVEGLRKLPFREAKVRAARSCGGKEGGRAEARLRRGTVLGVLTGEGRLGKIRVEECDRKLELSWTLYDELFDGAERGSREASAGPRPGAARPPAERGAREDPTPEPAGPARSPWAECLARVERDGPVHTFGGEGFRAPRVLESPTARYTEEARRHGITGIVIAQSVIDRQGRVACLKVVKGLPLGLDESATSTMRRRTFEPATLDGEPVAVFYNLTTKFSLSR